jgi:hypothetical protein
MGLLVLFVFLKFQVNMIKFIYKFDLSKSLKIHWHKAKVSNLKIGQSLKSQAKKVFEKGERF